MERETDDVEWEKAMRCGVVLTAESVPPIVRGTRTEESIADRTATVSQKVETRSKWANNANGGRTP